MRTPLLAVALACLAVACSEEEVLPPLEEHPPPFAFSLYLREIKKGVLGVIPGADVKLVRRPLHLEHVYKLFRDRVHPEHAQAVLLFGNLEAQFKGAGEYVAKHVYSLRCTAVELPDCVPKWNFIEELLGPGDGPGARRLRQVLADSFAEQGRALGMRNTVVVATVNVLLTRGMLKSAVSRAATVEARALAPAEQRAVVVEAPVAAAPRVIAGEGRAAAVGAEQLAVDAGRLRLAADVPAIEARLVEAEALAAGARQTAVVAELAGKRPMLASPLPGAAGREALWRDYVAYWARRYEELASPDALAKGVKGPLEWPGYLVFRTRVRAAIEVQASVAERLRGEAKLPPAERMVLKGMKQPLTETNVGLKREGRNTVVFVDHLAVDGATLKSSAPRVESISTKQRDFKRMSREEARDQVRADVREALTKYGGEVEVRRRGHPLFGRRVTVSRVHLMYDGGLVPELSEFREAMRKTAEEAGVGLHFHHAR
ncbi:MAG TPA: hypothetical protein VNA24_25710 [Hyalangium sp.]|nr:hypothetical protein [Hyalangium sp.]